MEKKRLQVAWSFGEFDDITPITIEYAEDLFGQEVLTEDMIEGIDPARQHYKEEYDKWNIPERNERSQVVLIEKSFRQIQVATMEYDHDNNSIENDQEELLKWEGAMVPGEYGGKTLKDFERMTVRELQLSAEKYGIHFWETDGHLHDMSTEKEKENLRVIAKQVYDAGGKDEERDLYNPHDKTIMTEEEVQKRIDDIKADILKKTGMEDVKLQSRCSL